MNFRNSRKRVLGQIFRKYVFDLQGDVSREFTDTSGRRYVPVVLEFSARLR